MISKISSSHTPTPYHTPTQIQSHPHSYLTPCRKFVLIVFGDSCNQPVIGWVLPESIKSINMGLDFDQPVVDWVLPASLISLDMGHCFDQPVCIRMGAAKQIDKILTWISIHSFTQRVGYTFKSIIENICYRPSSGIHTFTKV
jgi:hypothetical protein